MRAELGQLAGCEVGRGLRCRGEAAVDSGVQGDDGGQQVTLTHRETETTLLEKHSHRTGCWSPVSPVQQ